MTLENAAILMAWAIMIVMIIAVAPWFRLSPRLDRPAPQPLQFDPLDFDFDGPVIDLEPA